MPPPVPSHACWTCHARKKKCGGGQPACRTCEQLHVACYGYGDKPAWMDGGAAERKTLDEIRAGVKATTDRRRRARALLALRKRAPAETSMTIMTTTPALDVSCEDTLVAVEIRSECIGDPETIHSHDDAVRPWAPDANLEMLLLMHYLDRVFPLLFPFYDPPVARGGRGWILCLLEQTKPVRDAALSLAAFHRHVVLHERDGEPGVQRRLYALALQGLRSNIDTILSKTPGVSGLKDSIQIFACIIHLILLEVIQGGTENWLKHLRVGPDLINFMQIYCAQPDRQNNATASPPTIPPTPFVTPAPPKPLNRAMAGPPASHAGLTLVDHCSAHFFSSTLIWFDIIAAASIRQCPQYASICAAALGSDAHSSIQLQDFMGCENWAIILVRDVAVLDAWRADAQRRATLSTRVLASRAAALESSLRAGIRRVSELLVSRATKHPEDHGARVSTPEVLALTRAFATAALVYLHVATSGAYPSVPEMAGSVREALAALEALPTALVRCAVWPLCVAGCMAAAAEQAAWRGFVDAVRRVLSADAFGSVTRVWEVVETCWALRRDGETETGVGVECDWTKAMEAKGYRVLLI